LPSAGGDNVHVLSSASIAALTARSILSLPALAKKAATAVPRVLDVPDVRPRRFRHRVVVGEAAGSGYLTAAPGPLLHDLTAAWTVPLIRVTVIMVAQSVFGGLAGCDRFV
jgi:hypothetical protein